MCEGGTGEDEGCEGEGCEDEGCVEYKCILGLPSKRYLLHRFLCNGLILPEL